MSLWPSYLACVFLGSKTRFTSETQTTLRNRPGQQHVLPKFWKSSSQVACVMRWFCSELNDGAGFHPTFSTRRVVQSLQWLLHSQMVVLGVDVDLRQYPGRKLHPGLMGRYLTLNWHRFQAYFHFAHIRIISLIKDWKIFYFTCLCCKQNYFSVLGT